MKILSLDLSTKSTGFAIFDGEQLIEYGCLTATSYQAIARIKKIANQILELINKHNDIEKIIVEEVRPENDQRGVGNLRTHKVLMWLQAALEFLIFDNFSLIKIEYIYPSEWRSKCGIHTGKGIHRDALKQADIKFVKDKYGILVNDDIADAIGIGYAYTTKETNEINWE